MSETAIKNDGYPDLKPGMRVRAGLSPDFGGYRIVIADAGKLRFLHGNSVCLYPDDRQMVDWCINCRAEISDDEGKTWHPYRRAEPEPEYEPFTSETFPPLNRCEIRHKCWKEFGHGDRCQPVYVSVMGVSWIAGDMNKPTRVSFAGLLEEYEIRINGGEWQKCGVRK